MSKEYDTLIDLILNASDQPQNLTFGIAIIRIAHCEEDSRLDRVVNFGGVYYSVAARLLLNPPVLLSFLFSHSVPPRSGAPKHRLYGRSLQHFNDFALGCSVGNSLKGASIDTQRALYIVGSMTEADIMSPAE
jgi:hypothetical protein